MAIAKLVLVDDDAVLRAPLAEVIRLHGFDVTVAANVPEALRHFTAGSYDALLNAVPMPEANEDLIVLSVTRHASPDAIALLLSAFREIEAAAHAVFLKSTNAAGDSVRQPAAMKKNGRVLSIVPPTSRVVESLATILQRSTQSIIDRWFERVQEEESLMAVPLSVGDRCRRLPELLHDLVSRLYDSRSIDYKATASRAATQHGVARRQQGYTAAMMVEESRILQASIFETLQNNLDTIDFNVLMIGVLAIADEIYSQLNQAMTGYMHESMRLPLEEWNLVVH